MKEDLSTLIRKGNSTQDDDALADAAEDLLAACVEMDKLIAGNRPLYDVVAKLRAAIAKATGK